MFGHVQAPFKDAHLPISELLGISEQTKNAFYELVEPSEAANLSRQQLVPKVSAALLVLAERKMLPYNQHELSILCQQLVDEMIGVGPIQPLLDDPTVSDILVNGPETVYVERFGKLELTSVRFRNKEHVLNVAQRIVNAIGRRIDESTPMVDARLSDGSRVNIIAPPVALMGTTISIRKFPSQRLTLQHLVEHGSLSAVMADFLALASHCRCNILVSGGTGSGKTTLLNALSRHISNDERILTIEDAAELSLDQPHWVALETRTESAEGKGEVTIRDLVRNSLRMRPDRIILGEVRGVEAFDMLQAMNTGHDGSLCTLHANSSADALMRLANMLQMGAERLSEKVIQSQIVSAIDLVVQLERMRDGKRRITEVAEISHIENDKIIMKPLFHFQVTGHDGEVLSGQYKANTHSQSLLDKALVMGKQSAMEACFHSKIPDGEHSTCG